MAIKIFELIESTLKQEPSDAGFTFKSIVTERALEYIEARKLAIAESLLENGPEDDEDALDDSEDFNFDEDDFTDEDEEVNEDHDAYRARIAHLNALEEPNHEGEPRFPITDAMAFDHFDENKPVRAEWYDKNSNKKVTTHPTLSHFKAHFHKSGGVLTTHVNQKR